MNAPARLVELIPAHAERREVNTAELLSLEFKSRLMQIADEEYSVLVAELLSSGYMQLHTERKIRNHLEVEAIKKNAERFGKFPTVAYNHRTEEYEIYILPLMAANEEMSEQGELAECA